MRSVLSARLPDAVVVGQAWDWNDRDEEDPWAGAPFCPLERIEVRWTSAVTADTVVDMIASPSYVIALPGSRRADLTTRVHDLAVEGRDSVTGRVPVRWVTRGYRTRRP